MALAAPAAAAEPRIVVASDPSVLERTDLSVGLLVGHGSLEWVGMSGGRPGLLTSASTRQRGLVTLDDVVGGVVTVAVAGTVAALWPLHGRRLVLTGLAPLAALAALAAIDLATGADSRFTQTVLNEPGDLVHVLGHRYALAWDSLSRAGMLVVEATAAALALATWGIRRRAAFVHFPGWSAALAGGLAGAVAGALANDSGPLLFVLAVAVLTVAAAYLRTGASRTEAVQTGP